MYLHAHTWHAGRLHSSLDAPRLYTGIGDTLKDDMQATAYYHSNLNLHWGHDTRQRDATETTSIFPGLRATRAGLPQHKPRILPQRAAHSGLRLPLRG